MSEEEKAELEELYENSEWWHNRFKAVQRDYENLQQRIDKAVTRIKTIINIIKEQPTDNIHTDMYIIEALNSLLYILEEEEENE